MSTLNRIKEFHQKLANTLPNSAARFYDSGKTPCIESAIDITKDAKKCPPLVKISDIVKDELSAMSYIDKKGCPHSYDNDEELEIMGVDIVTDPRVDPLEIIDFAHENSRAYKKVIKTFEEKSSAYSAEIADSTATANEG